MSRSLPVPISFLQLLVHGFSLSVYRSAGPFSAGVVSPWHGREVEFRFAKLMFEGSKAFAIVQFSKCEC